MAGCSVCQELHGVQWGQSHGSGESGGAGELAGHQDLGGPRGTWVFSGETDSH